MIVVDASALATALTDDGADGDLVRARLRGEVLAGPEQALGDLMALPVQRAPHLPLLARCWSLRDTLGVYDASYVALAESLSGVLLTADVRLSRAPGLRCVVEVLQRSGPTAWRGHGPPS